MWRVMMESLGFEGMFHATKQYLQRLLELTAMALPFLLFLSDMRRTALLVGGVYFVLHVMSSLASRHAHRVVEHAGGEEAAADVLWRVNWALFAALVGSLAMGWHALAIAAFVCLMVIQNIWRPALVSRINAHSTPELGATVLSIEAQAMSLGTMIAAPCVGWAVDATGSLWPVAAAGLLVATVGLASRIMRREATAA